MSARILRFPTAVRSEGPKPVFAFESLPQRSHDSVTGQTRAEPERLISEPRMPWRAEPSDLEPFTA